MTAQVQDGRDAFGCSLEAWATGRCDPPRNGMLPRMAAAIGARVPLLSVVADVAPIPARVDWGRWCAPCPCGGAEMVWIEGPHQIWCAVCGNAALAGQWRPVSLPDRVHEIIVTLGERPHAKDRNWMQPQTVEDLQAWNVENLTPSPVAVGGEP